MVLSSGEILTIGSGVQSQVGGSTPVRLNVKKQEEKEISIPKAKIKYHKIHKHEKYKIKGDIPEYYVSDVKVPRTNAEKMMELNSKFKLVTFKIPDETKDFYIKSCYQIDFIEAPIRHKGEGTKAVKNLVEKAMTEKDIEGRIIVDVQIIDGETSAAGFFYKLGFKFVNSDKNKIMDNWQRNTKEILPPKLTGIMYLPKEGVKRLLMYRMLL